MLISQFFLPIFFVFFPDEIITVNKKTGIGHKSFIMCIVLPKKKQKPIKCVVLCVHLTKQK